MEILNFSISYVLDILLKERTFWSNKQTNKKFIFLLYIGFSVQLYNVFSLISKCLARLQMCLKGSWHVCKLDKVGGNRDWQRELSEVFDKSARAVSIKGDF